MPEPSSSSLRTPADRLAWCEHVLELALAGFRQSGSAVWLQTALRAIAQAAETAVPTDDQVWPSDPAQWRNELRQALEKLNDFVES